MKNQLIDHNVLKELNETAVVRMDNEKKVKVIDKLRKKNCHWYMPILVKEIQML